jgi:phosphatidylethanolamine-binding protein (PEBP) family uncharacterized protein
MRNLVALSVSLLAVALAGCGSGGASSTTSAGPSIAFTSPALTPGKVIPARFKCNIRTAWLPLEWGALPAHTQELALYIISFNTPKLATGGTAKAEIKATALVVGLAPTLHGLTPGKYPRGVHVGVHKVGGEGVSICPQKGVTQNLLFRLYALPRKLNLHGAQGANLVNAMSKESLEDGTFLATYRSA